MNLLRPVTAAPGDWYLVDLGKLVGVAAVSASGAFHMAMGDSCGSDPQLPAREHPLVYQLDTDGAILAVFD